MPNRILRDWTDSLTIDELTADEERFFVRLIMKADDFGRFHAEPRLLVAALYPLKTADICPRVVVNMLSSCQRLGLVILGKCSKGRKYLQIVNHQQRTRSQNSKFPDFATLSADNCQQPADNCRLETETETETETYAETVKASTPSEIPTKDEILDYGERIGAAKQTSQNFFDWYQGKNLWLNKHEKLINWKHELAVWRERDKNGFKLNGKSIGSKQKIDRNENTTNKGQAHRYAGVGRVVSDQFVQ